MAQSPINSHQFSFNAKRIDWGIELVDQPYGGSGKLVVEWVWLWNQMNGASNVSWSAHNSLSFNQKKFDWLKRIDCRRGTAAFTLFLLLSSCSIGQQLFFSLIKERDEQPTSILHFIQSICDWNEEWWVEWSWDWLLPFHSWIKWVMSAARSSAAAELHSGMFSFLHFVSFAFWLLMKREEELKDSWNEERD